MYIEQVQSSVCSTGVTECAQDYAYTIANGLSCSLFITQLFQIE